MRAYKCERRAEESLEAEGMEFFIPKKYAVRVYHGVKSRRLVPVIPGLVFVRAAQRRLADFKKRHNFLQFAVSGRSSGPEYMVVSDSEMESFVRVASSPEAGPVFCLPEEVDLARGAKVRIHGGCLDGVSGVFVRMQGGRERRLVVVLEGIMAVAASVRPDLIEILPS